MPSQTIAAYTVSDPIIAPRGALVTVKPAPGASARVEYTSIDNVIAVRNGGAPWSLWRLGSVSAAASDLLGEPVYLRVIAVAGAVVFDIDERPSDDKLAAFRTEWSGPTPTVLARALRGAAKWFGAAQNSNTFNESSSVFTLPTYGAGMKIEAEAPFSAVRLYWVSRTQNAMTGSKAIVGVTETADTSVAAQAFHPRIGGSTYNTVVAAPATLGWRAVTWGGNATVDHPAANTAAQVKVSDWVPLSSVPRADGGSRPLLLIRAEHDGAAGGAFATFSNAAISTLRTASAAARGRILQLFTGTNLVSTPAAVNGGLQTACFEIYPEFRYSVPSLSVCGVGDSITQCEGLGLTGVVTSWGMRACAEISTTSRPVNWLSCGASGKQFTEYWARFLELFNAGYTPDVLVVTPLSVNDYSADLPNMSYYLDRGKMRAQEVFEFAQANKIRALVFFPLCPYNSLSAADDAKRQEYNAWLRDFAAATGSYCLNLAGLGNGASPERWVAGYNYATDGIHPNEAAIDGVLTPAAVAVLGAIA